MFEYRVQAQAGHAGIYSDSDLGAVDLARDQDCVSSKFPGKGDSSTDQGTLKCHVLMLAAEK